jgi:hypothetical protein
MSLMELFPMSGTYRLNKGLARRLINEGGYWRQRPLWMPDHAAPWPGTSA